MDIGNLFRRLSNSPAFSCGIIVVVVLAVYGQVSGFDFIVFDDNIHVYANPYFQPVNPANLLHFWLHPYQSLYIPISYMVFAGLRVLASVPQSTTFISEYSSTINPHVFHIANLLLHLANSILVFCLIRRVVKTNIPAMLGTLLFAIHPLQVESVAWVAELRGLLSALLSLSAIYLYQSDDRPDFWKSPAYYGAATLFALSLLAKPDAAAFPVVLFVWELSFRNKPAKETLVKLSAWFALAVSDTVVTKLVQTSGKSVVLPWWQRTIVALDSLGFYVEKVVWPQGLTFMYARQPQMILPQHLEYATITALVACVAVVLIFGRKHRWALTCLATFILFLLPVSGIIPFAFQFYSDVADRYAYLALLGPAFAIAYGLSEIGAVGLQRIALGLIASILTVLACLTSGQTSAWKSTAALFTYSVAINPDDWFARLKLGRDDLLNKLYPESEAQFRYFAEHGPATPQIWSDVATAEEAEGQGGQAISDFSKALRLGVYGPAYYGRAACEVAEGNHLAAVTDYLHALGMMPESANVDYLLGMELGATHRYAEAATQFRHAISAHPTLIQAYYYLALTYMRLHNPGLAKQIAIAGLQVDPSCTQLNQFLAGNGG